MSEYRPIIMRSNRLLGAALVEKNLITVDQLNDATERFLQILETATIRESSLLSVLINETKALTEESLLDFMVEDQSLAPLDLREIDPQEDVKLRLDPGVCWATWSVPFDRDEDVHYVASAYCLSAAVRQYWEKTLGQPIIWFATTVGNVSDFLEKLEAERAAHGNPVTVGAA